MLIVSTAFAFFGITLSLAAIGSATQSVSSVAFALIGLVLMPVVYGAVSAKTSEMFGEGDFPSNVEAEDVALFWIHGLVISVVMMIVTAVFALFGVTLSFAILGTAFDSLKFLAFALLAFAILPIVFGTMSDEITELLH